MKAKFINEVLNEKPKFDKKDLERIQDIAAKPYNDQSHAAGKMIKLIKDPEKALRRYFAAKELNLENTRIADAFLDRAAELGSEEAKQLKKEAWEKYLADVHEKVRIKQDAKMPIAEKIANAINKAVPQADATVSRSCQYPQWNYAGLFINIRGFLGDDTPYAGYTPGGPAYITNYRKQILGKNLFKIATIVKRFENQSQAQGLYKDSSNFFIKINI